MSEALERAVVRAPAAAAGRRPRMVVFGDDWGRHPSSIQHLAGELLARYDVDWINMVGTRPLRLGADELRRGVEKIRSWTALGRRASGRDGLRVHDPWMWPSFRSGAARRWNARVLERRLAPILFGDRDPVAVVTTHPLVADLARRTTQLNWIYYCVDAFDLWPGLEHAVLERMEEQLVRVVRGVVASSRALAERLAERGCDARELTHGVDIEHWKRCGEERRCAPVERARALYFGSVDGRLDPAICLALAERMELVLLGPQAQVDPALRRHPSIRCEPPVAYERLPDEVARADVLVMPFADLPVTRCMQPLKLKECLASGKPVVATPIPASVAWRSALDLAVEPEAFAELALARAGQPLPSAQRVARRRLVGEGWGAKARRFEVLVRRREPLTVLNVRLCRGRGGGPERLILPAARPMHRAGYREISAYLVDPADEAFAGVRAEAARLCCPLHTIEDRHPADWSVLKRLEELCRRERVRIWHGHDYKSDLLGLLLRRRLGLRLVATVHGWVHHTMRTPAYYAVDRWCLRRYDRVITVSSDLERRCLQIGVDRARVHRIESAVEPPGRLPVQPRREQLAVGALGRLEPEKGFDLLIEAFERAVERGVDAELTIAGEGGERERLRARIASSPQAGRVRLAGFVPDARAFLAGLDVFVLPSRREGLPLALLDALALGLATIATRAGGIADAVEDGREALLVDVGDVAGMAAALERLARDRELRAGLGDAARSLVRARFGLRERARRVAAVYDSLR